LQRHFPGDRQAHSFHADSPARSELGVTRVAADAKDVPEP